MEKSASTRREMNTFQVRRKQNRFLFLSAALVVALVSPFGLHWALEASRDPLAAFFFGLFTLALAMTALIAS
ncbi:MAG TPA: hypothetical protein VLH85_05360 [Levilinea sp.]|nr:hypothetical protein [Levilinea sp.]